MKGNYAIAVCDILGFSSLVQGKPLDSVVQEHLEWLRKALYYSIYKEFPAKAPSLRALQDQGELGLAWFSDTVLIYTLEDTDDNLRALTICLGCLLFATVFKVGTRLRCGVSYGEAFMDAENSIYVGKPLIEAYCLQQAQAWSGGALTRKAVERLPAPARTGQYRWDWFLVPYEVPKKGNRTVRTLAIDWTIGVHDGPDFLRWSKTDAVPPEDEWEKRPDVCEKWQNTKRFHDSVCKRCNQLAPRLSN
ncbi:MAG: hypothetical protein H8D43_00460 [Chloroflexi bacterium]|nr:hypothetical protein [Chloroflexota bacterium]